MKKHRTLKFFVALFIVVSVLAGILVGGYFVLDKAVVPKYFGKFGINNMSDLVGMMTTLYNNKSDKDIATNPFSSADSLSAENKLIEVGFPKLANGKLDYKAFAEGNFTPEEEGEVSLTDRELASLVDGMLASGVLADKLPNLKYINTINMNLLELIITPEVTDGVLNPKKATGNLILKIDTTSVRSQMAAEMDMPLFLLNMIVPKTLYISDSFTMELIGDEWEFSGNGIGVNGKTSQQSRILLNLLIDFIFPVEDEMTIEKLEENFGNVIIYGASLIGSAEFTNSIYSTNQNGVIITLK